jgi:hypothetical protein
LEFIPVVVGTGLGKIKRKSPIIAQSKPALSRLYLTVDFE